MKAEPLTAQIPVVVVTGLSQLRGNHYIVFFDVGHHHEKFFASQATTDVAETRRPLGTASPAEEAATEQDPVRMLELITEINRLLLEKEERLVRNHSTDNNSVHP